MSWEVAVTFDASNAPLTANAGPPVLGFYKVGANASKFVPANGSKKPYIELTLSIIEASHATSEVGNSVREFVNVPTLDQPADKRAWTERFLKTAMVGLGHDPQAIASANGAMKLSEAVFDGREGYIHYEPYVVGDKNTKSYLTWVSPEQYARGVAGNFKVALRNKAKSAIDAAPRAAAVAPSGFMSTPAVAIVPVSNGVTPVSTGSADLAELLG